MFLAILYILRCSVCGGKMTYVGTSNGAETYACSSCGNQISYVVE